jgi:hypothetical protein
MKLQRTFEWLAAVAFLVCIADLLFVAVASQRPADGDYYLRVFYVRDFFGLRWWIAPPVLCLIAVCSLFLSRGLVARLMIWLIRIFGALTLLVGAALTCHFGFFTYHPNAVFIRLSFGVGVAILSVGVVMVSSPYSIRWLARVFESGKPSSIKPHHLLAICGGWILGTFALHCWVLYTLVATSSSLFAKNAYEHSMGLAAMINGYAGTPEEQMRARAAMQMPGPTRLGATNLSVEQKLAMTLKVEQNAESYLKSLAAMADSAERQVAKRAWISWAVIAFTPIIVVIFANKAVHWKTERLSQHDNAPY